MSMTVFYDVESAFWFSSARVSKRFYPPDIVFLCSVCLCGDCLFYVGDCFFAVREYLCGGRCSLCNYTMQRKTQTLQKKQR